MIDEQGRDANAKHGRYEEQEQQIEFACLEFLDFTPKFNKILDRCERHVDTIQDRVEEKQNEELVVTEANAVVHPWTMMIHFENTFLTNTAMMTPIGLDTLALVTIAYTARCGPRVDGQIACSLIQVSFRALVGPEHVQVMNFGFGQVEVFTRCLDSSEYGHVVGP